MGRQLRLELRRPTSYRRDEFIVSPTNESAVQAIDSWPHWHAGRLALVGPPGSGKSHLARAWAEQVGAVILVAGEDDQLQELEPLQSRPVLIEDADHGAPDDTLFHLINRAEIAGGGLLLTARTPPTLWSATLPDLRSRLNALAVAELPPPDDIVLEGVLRKFFREQNVRPTDDLIPYLIRRIERSVPYARSLVERLDDLADAERRPVSRALARQILEGDNQTPELFD